MKWYENDDDCNVDGINSSSRQISPYGDSCRDGRVSAAKDWPLEQQYARGIQTLWHPDTLAPGHFGPGARLRRFMQVANILAESNHSRAVQHGSLFPKMKKKIKIFEQNQHFQKKIYILKQFQKNQFI